MTTPQVPIHVGQRKRVQAVRLNDDGDGVAAIEGMSVFVPQLLPGETAEVEIVQVERRFGRGQVVERYDAAPVRTDPVCSVFGACGGCQMQHFSYTHQLEHKRSVVEQTLIRSAKLLDVTVLPTLGMGTPWHYRNQVQIPLQYVPDEGRYVSGFFAAHSHRVVETQECGLEALETERTVPLVLGVLTSVLGERASSVHHLVMRYSFTTKEQMIVLVVDHAGLDLSRAAQEIGQFPGVVSVGKTVQPKRHGPVWGPRVDVLWGVDHLTERMGELEFLISPRSFFQVNTLQAQKLYDKVLEYASPQATDSVLDAYCGTGTMGLLFARQVKRVLGIESVAPAVADARKNAKHNHIANATFEVGEVEHVLPQRIARGDPFDIVVLDPPRKGCHPDVLQAVMDARPRTVVYVSCNHVTLARDLRTLVDGGYDVREVLPVDMFPQTSHVECVVALHRRVVTP